MGWESEPICAFLKESDSRVYCQVKSRFNHVSLRFIEPENENMAMGGDNGEEWDGLDCSSPRPDDDSVIIEPTNPGSFQFINLGVSFFIHCSQQLFNVSFVS